MNRNFLPIVAVALLAGPMAANATIIYDFQRPVGAVTFFMQYSSDDFITSNLFLPPSDPNLTCNVPAGFTCLDVRFTPDFIIPRDEVAIDVIFNGIASAVTATFQDGVLSTLGTFSSISGNATLTITSVPTSVPEPGTLALFGLALVGLGLMRRRRLI